MDKTCPHCDAPLIEIDHFGDRLVGCAECNRWGWLGGNDLSMLSKEEDITALRERARPN
jgi:uncharacterized Zn finger protein (UPF0148 family)